jgi:GNAT superfamily N-acetyltransferase
MSVTPVPGRLRQRVTYLEMTAPPALTAAAGAIALPEGAGVERLHPVDIAAYLDLFRAIGERWLWFERLMLSPAAMARLFADPAYEVRVLQVDGTACGLAELDRRQPGDVEIVYLGVTPDRLGRGLGRFLLADTLNAAWQTRPCRVWLHTCDHDHPGALAFYIAAGFRPFREEDILVDDPRLTGVLPRTAAPHVPLADEGV